jgi:hypothetical protein
MGFLQDAGVAGMDAAELDFTVANGVYPAFISESKIDDFKGKTKWQITYKINDDESDYHGRTVSEWFDLDPNLPENRKQWLARRLASLQISPGEQEDLEPQDIIGTEVTVTVKNKPSPDGTRTFTNVTKVVLGTDQIAAASFMSNF